jgi:uncharacterized protein YndB with AHSA1/START domain
MNETAKITSPQNSVIHSTFSIERIYPHAPARVFFAHADQAMKRRWFAEGEGWSIDEYMLDFRLNGSEVSRFRYQDGPEIRYDAAFYDIIPDRRIVFAYRMAIGSKPLSVSLSTMNCSPVPVGRYWPTPSKARTSMTRADRRVEKKGLGASSKSSQVSWRAQVTVLLSKQDASGIKGNR